MSPLTFGNKVDGVDYIRRTAAYGLFFQSGKLAVVQTSDGNYFLPGGGIEQNETQQECIIREAVEEMGMEIQIMDYIGVAQRYFYSTNEYKYYLSEGHFFLCEITRQIGQPLEEGHILIWMKPFNAIEELFHEHQSWAVREAIDKISSI
ncbi:NUDIX hydrolase [Bacillus sp. B1-b2]|uniref:NUDIX hydrolase n=1 Tax=Bacillus sp. B1-b2 TaxID=2653201 RepID=UPI001261F3F8|nr:NUDIX domain-containing protein [Bacillus sp. B1-b2]KAB7663017.1 NUDIX domain-containing protein [Bacillus sp. B1-b2]